MPQAVHAFVKNSAQQKCNVCLAQALKREGGKEKGEKIETETCRGRKHLERKENTYRGVRRNVFLDARTQGTVGEGVCRQIPKRFEQAQGEGG